jgi:formylglycine-generating enzyme required for sulfatase activity
MRPSKNVLGVVLLACVCMILSSCGAGGYSSTTGWNYNDPNNGGFEKVPYVEQETGPGLILIEGGTFTMGRVIDDVNYDWNNIPRRVTVSSFYMDETEVKNLDWREYLYWLGRVYGTDYPEVYKKALPDTLVWRSKLAYNEPYVNYYLRHPAYNDYPVVGVNWLQASDYCAWRTDRVNEQILIREGLLEHFPQQVNQDHFSTDAYLAGQYDLGKVVDGIEDLNPDRETRNVRMEDGILLPIYRLPTEAEWEFAAYGLIGNSFQELVTNRKVYPWNGNYVRNDDPSDDLYGTFNANFVRGRGDYMGVAGNLNDNADVTAPVFAYPPNDYGLYNMAGNVSEWVMDVYRPLTFEDDNEFRPFRGNVYQTKMRNSEGMVEDKLTEVVYDVQGVKYFLEQFEKTSGNKWTEAEATFMGQISSEVDKAAVKETEREYDARNEFMQGAVDMIKANEDVSFGAMVLNGFSDYIESTPGNIPMRDVTIEENIDRRNYREADYIDYVDGDKASSIYYENEGVDESNVMYDWGATTLINDRARVYKGGSWADRAYYTIPGTRRFLDERQSTAMIGFRCAMDRVGSPTGFGY